jgi:glycosyltransferase involved in cell wall biosynthesis
VTDAHDAQLVYATKPQRVELSVIITCFNYEAFVGEAIDSALRQGSDSIEIIVVDDGSTDESWSRIRSYGDRVKAIRTPRQGALGASLAGLKLASGGFVYFLDADDVLCEGAFGVLAQHLHSRVSKIQFMLTPINKQGEVIGPPFPKLQDSRDSARLIKSIMVCGYYSTPPTSGNVYRRDIYDGLGDLTYERAIDGVPYLLAPFLGEVVSIGRTLAKYRIHDANLSSFSELSPERLNGYAGRFLNRLIHLEKILESRKLNGHGFRVKKTYSYLLEIDILSRVVSRERIGWALMRSYSVALGQERSGLPKHAFFLFYSMLAFLPKTMATRLARFRLNQASGTWVRRRLKWLVHRL